MSPNKQFILNFSIEEATQRSRYEAYNFKGATSIQKSEKLLSKIVFALEICAESKMFHEVYHW